MAFDLVQPFVVSLGLKYTKKMCTYDELFSVDGYFGWCDKENNLTVFQLVHPLKFKTSWLQ